MMLFMDKLAERVAYFKCEPQTIEESCASEIEFFESNKEQIGAEVVCMVCSESID